MKAYINGKTIQMRGAGGKFRHATLRDVGVTDANDKAQEFICNVCGRHFTPVVHSGICCGVDNKTPVPPPVESDEVVALREQMQAIKNKPFISRQDLNAIQQLQWDISAQIRKENATS